MAEVKVEWFLDNVRCARGHEDQSTGGNVHSIVSLGWNFMSMYFAMYKISGAASMKESWGQGQVSGVGRR